MAHGLHQSARRSLRGLLRGPERRPGDRFGDTVSFTIPPDIITSRPPPQDPKQPPYGLSYVFFAVCAGTFERRPRRPPISRCAASTRLGMPLGSNDFVAGYRRSTFTTTSATKIPSSADCRSTESRSPAAASIPVRRPPSKATSSAPCSVEPRRLPGPETPDVPPGGLRRTVFRRPAGTARLFASERTLPASAASGRVCASFARNPTRGLPLEHRGRRDLESRLRPRLRRADVDQLLHDAREGCFLTCAS